MKLRRAEGVNHGRLNDAQEMRRLFDNFIWEQIAEAQTKEELDSLEIFYIQQYASTNPEKGYNGKEGGARGKNSEATRKKISEIVHNSPQFKTAMRSTEMRQHRAEIRIGAKHSKDTKEKMSFSAMGNQRARGAIRSPETRRRIGEATRLRWERKRNESSSG